MWKTPTEPWFLRWCLMIKIPKKDQKGTFPNPAVSDGNCRGLAVAGTGLADLAPARKLLRLERSAPPLYPRYRFL